MPRVVWAGESKTGLGHEIGSSQQKYQRKSSLQSMTNPTVFNGSKPMHQLALD